MERDTRYRQVGKLLQWIVDFHDEQGKAYAAGARAVSNPRTRMALQYLAEHEQSMQAGLRRYLVDADRDVMDTWFDDVTHLPHVSLLMKLPRQAEERSVEDVIADGITMHTTLEALYRHRAATAAIVPLAELFNALADQQNAELRRMVRDMGRLQEM